MITIVYARLSSDDPDAKRAGVESCDVQIANARRFISERGWRDEVVEVVDDGVSGAEVDRRAGLQRVLSLVRGGKVARVVVRDLDRIARLAVYFGEIVAALDRADVELWSYVDRARIDTRGLGYAMAGLKATFAEQERASAAKRTREALRFRAEAGRAVGKPPYGYRIEKDSAGNKRDVKHPEEVDRLLEIARIAVASTSLSAAAHKLNDIGVLTPTGTFWRAQTLGEVLRRPRYRGELVFGDERQVAKGGTLKRERGQSDALRLPRPDLRIWPEELLAQIEELLARCSRPSPAGAAKPAHLAAGFVTCGICGHSLTAHGKRSNYACSWHASRGRAACVGIGYRPEATVDIALVTAVAPLVDGRVAARAMSMLRERLRERARVSGRDAARERAKRALAEAERRSTNLIAAIAQGDAPEPLLVELRATTKRVDDLKAELSSLSSPALATLDMQRVIAAATARLRELTAIKDAGGVAARPLLAAVLGGSKFTATPVVVDGERRWQLTARVSGGYLSNVISGQGVDCPGQAAGLRASTRHQVANR